MDFFSLMFIIITYSFNNVSSKIIIDTINTNISWLYLTKFYFHPIYGQIDISLYSLENTIRFFVLNKQEWIEIKNDLSNICLKNELKLNRTKNETNLWSLSSSFTSIGQMHFILSKCNSSLNTTDLPFTYKLVLTNGDNLFMKHFSDDERGILPLFIVSTCIHSILLLIVVRYTFLSKNKSCLIIKLYVVSIVFSWLNSFIYSIETLIYAFIGNIDAFIFQSLIFLARLLFICAQILFLLLLILSTKGCLTVHVQLKKNIMTEIILIISLYIFVQIVIFIIMTTFINQVFANENILLISNYIQMILYLLTCVWFIICLIFTSKPPTKSHRSFFIFSIWFITNAIVVLLNILDVLPNLQITILTAMTISMHFVAYCIFLFIIQTKTFLLRTKLNQINIAYIDPTLSKTHIQDLLTREKEVTTASCELTDLYSIGNANKSKLRMPLKSFETFRRLEPRRDVLLSPSLQSCIVSIQPSVNPISPPLITTEA
ncbi:unnamed protein product [Rotaria socialis]|uniref:GPR180/TMEM145 transmembrane domain-containing protein n=1 Tax=Rotaria socialis TaxID=392032 RepID=A0A818EQM7_9BILA|nr:unnamed protein product [Rotaria socialis]CAF3777366.1 unnamed protein product [Rotaria socialis]